jgi:hypothetical protein
MKEKQQALLRETLGIVNVGRRLVDWLQTVTGVLQGGVLL